MPLILSESEITLLLDSLTGSSLIRLSESLLYTLSLPASSIQQPARSSVTTPSGTTTLFMPCTSSALGLTTLKTITLPPAPAPASATLALHSATAGSLLALLNATPLTAFRTALASLLVPTDASFPGGALTRIVIFGNGPIALTTARLLRTWAASAAEITVVTRREIDPPVWTDGPVLVRGRDDGQLQEALGKADGVFCCTPSTAPLFPTEWLKLDEPDRKGVYISLIGSYRKDMVEVDPALLKREADVRVLVDGRRECAAEAGEVIQAGLDEEGLQEVGEWLTRPDEEGRSKWDRKHTLFKCVGLAAMDAWVGREVVRIARERGIGREIEF